MSSNQSSNDANNVSSGGKKAPPGDDTGSKSANSQHVPSTSGHEVTGAEKFVENGGSGGVPIRTGQGYEHLARH